MFRLLVPIARISIELVDANGFIFNEIRMRIVARGTIGTMVSISTLVSACIANQGDLIETNALWRAFPQGEREEDL